MIPHIVIILHRSCGRTCTARCSQKPLSPPGMHTWNSPSLAHTVTQSAAAGRCCFAAPSSMGTCSRATCTTPFCCCCCRKRHCHIHKQQQQHKYSHYTAAAPEPSCCQYYCCCRCELHQIRRPPGSKPKSRRATQLCCGGSTTRLSVSSGATGDEDDITAAAGAEEEEEEAAGGSTAQYFPHPAADDDRDHAQLVMQERVLRLEQMMTANRGRSYKLLQEVAAAGGASSSSDQGRRRWVVVVTAVEKETYEPRVEFRESMMEVIESNGLEEARELRHLLRCYMSINSRDHRLLILQAFHDVCVSLFF